MVDSLTRNILEKGLYFNQITLEGKMAEIESLKAWQRQELIWQQQKVQKTVDWCDVSEVNGCILATRLLCKRRTIVSEEAR